MEDPLKIYNDVLKISGGENIDRDIYSLLKFIKENGDYKIDYGNLDILRRIKDAELLGLVFSDGDVVSITPEGLATLERDPNPNHFRTATLPLRNDIMGMPVYGEAVANEMPFVSYPLQGGKWVCPECAKDIPIIYSIDAPETYIPIKDHMKYEHNYTDNQVENVLGIDYHSQQAHKNNLYSDGILGKSYFGGKWYDKNSYSEEAIANEMPFSGGRRYDNDWVWTCPNCSQQMTYARTGTAWFDDSISYHLKSHGYSDDKIKDMLDADYDYQNKIYNIFRESITSEADNYPQKQQMSQKDWNADLDYMKKTFGGANDEIEEDDGLDEDRVEIDISGDDVEIEDFDDEEDYFDDEEELEEFTYQGGDNEPEMEAEWKEVEKITNEAHDMTATGKYDNSSDFQWHKADSSDLLRIDQPRLDAYGNSMSSWKKVNTDTMGRADRLSDNPTKGYNESYSSEGMVYKNDVLEEIKLKPNSDLSYLEQMLSNFDDGDMTVSQAIQELQEDGKIEWTGRGYSVVSTESYASESIKDEWDSLTPTERETILTMKLVGYHGVDKRAIAYNSFSELPYEVARQLIDYYDVDLKGMPTGDTTLYNTNPIHAYNESYADEENSEDDWWSGDRKSRRKHLDLLYGVGDAISDDGTVYWKDDP